MLWVMISLLKRQKGKRKPFFIFIFSFRVVGWRGTTRAIFKILPHNSSNITRTRTPRRNRRFGPFWVSYGIMLTCPPPPPLQTLSHDRAGVEIVPRPIDPKFPTVQRVNLTLTQLFDSTVPY